MPKWITKEAMKTNLKDKLQELQKKEPLKVPVKIDKESAKKSLINFRQSLKKKKATSKGDD